MRPWIAILTLLTLFDGPARAQTQTQPRIDRVELLGTGIMKNTTKLKGIANKQISTGQRVEADTEIIEHTTTIPAKAGTIFGADVRIIGKAKGKMTTVKVVWRYPDPGIVNPATGKPKFVDEYEAERRIGDEVDTFFWSLQSEWVLVPGRWTLELWQGDRRLLMQEFTLVK